MADQEFLASFGVDIDETGVSRLQQILTENQTLAKSLSDSFTAASESVRAFREQIAADLPTLFSGTGYGNVTERTDLCRILSGSFDFFRYPNQNKIQTFSYHVKNCLPSHVKKCLTFAVHYCLRGNSRWSYSVFYPEEHGRQNVSGSTSQTLCL